MNKTLGFCRVGAAIPTVWPGAVSDNVASLADLAKRAAEAATDVLVFPELCVTGYTCADLFYQPALLSAAREGLTRFLKKTWQLDTLFLLGMPVEHGGALFNCAVACRQGNVLGIVPKSYLPDTHEFYEKRWFSPAAFSRDAEIRFGDEEVPFGTDLVFRSQRLPECAVGIELCEDMWAPVPPATRLALKGATVLCNLSASNELIGKTEYRRSLVAQESARCLAAYVYAGAGPGESSTDLVFGGHALVAENGRVLAERPRFSREPGLLLTDVDVSYLSFERRQNASFAACAVGFEPCREIVFDEADTRESELPAEPPLRIIDPRPFVPAGDAARNRRCEEIFAIQSTGLATRLLHTHCHDVVVGLSGGLDSALALLVICEAFKRLGYDGQGVHVLTLPGFGTTERTLANAVRLCKGLGVALEAIDISAACLRHLSDISHGPDLHDIAYENTQARERTQILMDKANMYRALVIGTGDLSELALGWCTYNGDHISMYGVNSGVPKTLVRYLVRWAADTCGLPEASAALADILDTPVSPELLPADDRGRIAQKTEDALGPYEVHDFFLYHMLRCGAAPAKLHALAVAAFKDKYAPQQLSAWQEVFIKRFFAQQFKRSCLPDGPKVGTLNLSPRGDWRMPSDASPDAWR